MLIGGNKAGMAETIFASELGMPVGDHVTIEANWKGPQEKEAGADAFVVINNEKGPYFIQVDAGAPIAYVPTTPLVLDGKGSKA